MFLIIQWVVTSLTILMVPYLVPGVSVSSFGAALAAAAVLGLLNLLIKPILFLLTLPITVLTLGLFYFVLNGLLFQLMGNLVVGVQVDSFGSALLASLLVSFVSWISGLSYRREENRNVIVVRRTRDLN